MTFDPVILIGSSLCTLEFCVESEEIPTCLQERTGKVTSGHFHKI